ncbi:MAG: ATP-dependent DNA helicase RecG [Hyphomonadaceae bacterium]
MRDPVVYPFYADLSSLPGVGPKLKPVLARLIGGETVLDLIYHLPTNWIDRRNRASIAEAPFGEVATITGEVDKVEPSRGKWPARIRLRDDTGFLTLVYFRANPQWLQRTFKLGESVMASGLVQQYEGGRQILHPDHVVTSDKDERPPEVEPIYPMTAGLAAKVLRKVIAAALDTLPALEEWIDPHLLEQRKWPAFRKALEVLHRPISYDPDAFHSARERLAYDEALAREIAVTQSRAARERRTAPPISRNMGVERTIIEALPFKLTRAQSDAIADVSIDMARPLPMRRLVQGDVGSGKTLIAAIAAAQVAASGRLTALMSPTEVLARQQAEAIQKFVEPAGFRCAPLTARDKGSAREATLEAVRAGQIQIISGTQALYQADVDLPELALVVIDEQHRFGVADRMKLTAKGASPHMLLMSATPIPRTMALALHGDMDVSIVAEKPAGRKEVVTAATPDSRVDDVMEAVARAARRGERAFWICPAVDSEDAGDGSAVARRDALAALVKQPVELVHGRMSPEERDAALDRFRVGKSRVLVATTVVEVGVDVPDATIIVIERAEKFGLAQLHQLRGRVGRGDKASSCLLLYRAPLTEAGRERLDTLRRTNDGFEIAEADFRLRGPGDVLGARQSGAPDFRVLDLATQLPLIETARTDARALLMADADLSGARGAAARLVRDLLAPRLATLVSEAD